MLKILFVGSFKTSAKDGSVGGQMFASKTIINSELGMEIDWTLLDSTANSNVTASIIKRAYKAIKRMFLFTYYLFTKSFDKILIFTGEGLSFWEKGLMAVMGKIFTSAIVIIAPRSGLIINDINKDGLLSKFIRYVLKRVDLVLCQSKTWQKYFIDLVRIESSNKFIVIENWIDITKYANFPIANLKLDRTKILFLSWVDKNKGIYELLEAAVKLKKKRSDWEIIIAGKGNDFIHISDLLKKNDLESHVVLKGWALGDEKLDLLRQSEIYILPSYFEGFPNSLMEAMVSGKACIATTVGAIPDMIIHGESGLLIEKEDSGAIYESILRLLDNPNERLYMGQNARNKIILENSSESAIVNFRKLLIN